MTFSEWKDCSDYEISFIQLHWEVATSIYVNFLD